MKRPQPQWIEARNREKMTLLPVSRPVSLASLDKEKKQTILKTEPDLLKTEQRGPESWPRSSSSSKNFAKRNLL